MAMLDFYVGRWQCETFTYPGKVPDAAATVTRLQRHGARRCVAVIAPPAKLARARRW
jgi:hypothetical protein